MTTIDERLHQMSAKLAILSAESKQFLSGKKNRALPVRKGLLEITKEAGQIRKDILDMAKQMPVKSTPIKFPTTEAAETVIIDNDGTAKVEAVDALLSIGSNIKPKKTRKAKAL